MSQKAPQLILNQVAVQERLCQWLKGSPHPVTLDYDGDQSTESELHFCAYNSETIGPNGDEDDNDDDENDARGETSPPEITESMWVQTAKFGDRYSFQEKADGLHIVVRAPSANQAKRLWESFMQQRSVLMAKTWNIYFVVFGLLLSFLSFCFWTAKLHRHWHKYESPWESMFHTGFQLFIWIGDVFVGRFFDLLP